MLGNLRRLLRYRALVQSLVARELKARYRGSVLGFFWSFVNPLLLLAVYTFVFTVVMPGARGTGVGRDPYALFMFCAFLPWTWFSAALLESSTVLIAGGNLIRKVLFPAEVLPIVTVLSTFVHFCLGLPILAGFFFFYRVPITPTDLLWFPVVVAVQLCLTLGLALLVSVLTVRYRDVRDLLANLLTLWFFATPIVYHVTDAPASVRAWMNLNPFTHLAMAYQEVLFVPGPFGDWRRLAVVGAASIGVLATGYAVFDRMRDTLPEDV